MDDSTLLLSRLRAVAAPTPPGATRHELSDLCGDALRELTRLRAECDALRAVAELVMREWAPKVEQWNEEHGAIVQSPLTELVAAAKAALAAPRKEGERG